MADRALGAAAPDPARPQVRTRQAGLMRALIAFDGSDGAAVAVALAESIPWPKDSVLRVVSVIEPMAMPMPGPWTRGVVDVPEFDATVSRQVGDANAGVVERLNRDGVSADGVVHRGRPADTIVEEAQFFGADLVVMGSRGHGRIASLLLGSVSTEVVHHAPCPVLVARRTSMSRVAFATDDSHSAIGAEACLAAWPIFEGLPIRVISVADVVHPWTTGIAPTIYRQALDTYAADLREAKEAHLRAAEASARRLGDAGRRAEAEMRYGDPAAEIIAGAEASGADLIVLGSRGLTGLARLLLGSVARNVLSGSAASVLVVRDTSQADQAAKGSHRDNA